MIYVHILIGDLAPCNIIPFFQPYQDWTKTLAKECQLWRYFEFLAGRFILLEVECDLKYMYLNVMYSFKDCPICKPRPQSRTLFSVTMVMSDCFIWHNNQPNSKIPVPDRFEWWNGCFTHWLLQPTCSPSAGSQIEKTLEYRSYIYIKCI